MTQVSLGVGAYRTSDGKPWILPVVKKAEAKERFAMDALADAEDMDEMAEGGEADDRKEDDGNSEGEAARTRAWFPETFGAITMCPVPGAQVVWIESRRPSVLNSAFTNPFSTGRPCTSWRKRTVILSVPLPMPRGR